MDADVRRDWAKRVKLRRRGSLERNAKPAITQVQLAALSGIDQSTISRLENAQLDIVSDDIKWRIAAALRCPIGDLFPFPNVTPPLPELQEAG